MDPKSYPFPDVISYLQMTFIQMKKAGYFVHYKQVQILLENMSQSIISTFWSLSIS